MSRSRSSIEKKNSSDDVKNRKSFILQKKMSDKTLAAQNILLYMHNLKSLWRKPIKKIKLT